ncbi:MAG: hypothetical protein ACO1RT_20610 [Planctomycetaceae bacterium]
MKCYSCLASRLQSFSMASASLAALALLLAVVPALAEDWPAEDSGFGQPMAGDEFYAEQDAYPDAVVAVPDEAWEQDASATCPCQGCHKAKCEGVCLDPGFPAKPKRTLPGDIDEGDCPSKRYRMDDRLRSGDPTCVYKWARPSITDKYSAWYVGGGAAFKGRGRTSAEGTWGLDYDGLFGHARTWLNYTCGKRQGGEGAYEGEHVPLKKKLRTLH